MFGLLIAFVSLVPLALSTTCYDWETLQMKQGSTWVDVPSPSPPTMCDSDKWCVTTSGEFTRGSSGNQYRGYTFKCVTAQAAKDQCEMYGTTCTNTTKFNGMSGSLNVCCCYMDRCNVNAMVTNAMTRDSSAPSTTMTYGSSRMTYTPGTGETQNTPKDDSYRLNMAKQRIEYEILMLDKYERKLRIAKLEQEEKISKPKFSLSEDAPNYSMYAISNNQ